MKKTLTMLLSLLLSVALIFTFVACNPSKDEGKSVTNSQIIESAFGALLDSEALHLSLKDVSASMGESALLETDPMEFKVGGDVYVRQTESGYDLVMDIELMLSFAETGTLDGSADESEEIDYLDNTFISFEVYYVDEQICTVMEDFSQVVVGEAGYSFFSQYEKDPEKKDAHIYTDLIGDYSAVDATIKNDVTKNGSRVSTDLQYRPANSLDDILTRLAEDVPVLKQLKLNSLEDYVSLLKRAGASVAKLDGGKTTPAEDGSKEFSAKLDLVSVYNSVVTFLNANMDNTIGAALDSIAGQGEKYVEKVIDRLFPATGDPLTIKQFIAALEETLGELGVDFSFKALVDEIQIIIGLTTEEIADVINPLLQNLGVSIVPEEGETLYDTLNNGAFKLLTVDGILALIPTGSGSSDGTEGGTEGTGSESTEEPLTSAMINEMLKEYAYNEEMTLSAIFELIELPIEQVLGMLDVQKGEVSFGISFDSENRLTEISISGAIGVYANMPAEEEGETMSVSAFVVDASATLIFEYTVDDSVFALPESVNTKEYVYEGDVDSGMSISAGDFLVQAGCVTEEEIGEITFYSDSVQFYGIDASGYVSSGDTGYVYDWDTSTGGYVIKMVAPSEYDYILAICCLEEGNYMIKLPVVTAAQA